MSDFATLKRNSKLQAQKLQQSFSKSQAYGNSEFWKPTFDEKTGKTNAVIRFLPAHKDEEVPFVQRFSHFIKGPGGVYNELSLTTIGQKDPVSEANKKIWDTNQDLARARARKETYIANILVLSDPGNPESQGKVFKYAYPKTIQKMIEQALNPPEDFDEAPVNVFDFWEGANFKLRAIKANGKAFWDYSTSKFDSPSPLLDGDDDALEQVYNKLYPLKDEIHPSKFKSYQELEAHFLQVIGSGSEERRMDALVVKSETREEPKAQAKPSTSRFARSLNPSAPAPKTQILSTEDDDLKAFADMLKDDDED